MRTVLQRIQAQVRQENCKDDFYAKQREEAKQLATHVRLDKNGEIYLYYKLKEVKYDNGTSCIRPQYLDVWGCYSFHSYGRRVDAEIIKILIPIV